MRNCYLLPPIGMALVLAVSGASLEPEQETFELTTATIADINAAFESGELTSEKLIELSLERGAGTESECVGGGSCTRRRKGEPWTSVTAARHSRAP
jgi:hypothetical protein